MVRLPSILTEFIVRHTYFDMRKTFVFLSLFMFLALGAKASDAAKPWTFWYWMYGAVSPEGIHADLLGMKQAGLGGCYLMPIRSSAERPDYHGQAEQLSPYFWQMVDEAFKTADSIGLDMGIHVCDGFALAGAPWIQPEQSMQKVVWTDTIVTGSPLGKVLRRPEGYKGYEEDIVTWAFPVASVERQYSLDRSSDISLSGDMRREASGRFRAENPGSIVWKLPQSDTLRSLTVYPSGNNIQSQRLRVAVSVDGIHYDDILQMQPPRQGWQSSSYPYTYALRPTLARYVRFSWTPEGTEPGAEDLDAAKWKPVLKLNNVVLSTQSRLSQFRGKAAYTWLIAPEDSDKVVPPSECLSLSKAVRLQLDGNRVVGASSPLPKSRATKWRILRFGHTSTGQQNATAGGGKGLEVDKFNVEATESLLSGWFEKFLSRPHSRVVKMLHVDSWECACQNWGKDFAQEFQRRRGYDLLPYMPLFAGLPVESAAKSEQVLRDVRQTIDDLVNDRFFATLTRRAHAVGREVSHESIAPTFVADGMRHYASSDLPMCEFWLNSPTHDKMNDMLDAVSGAHQYGKNIVQAEGFTELRGVWNETPAMLKSLLDRQYALGLNRLFFHVNAHNPFMNRRPGITLDGIGLFFQRDNTWYSEADGFTSYITRCQRLLQMGHPVVDVAVYSGSEMPRRSLTPDRLADMLPGLMGEKKVAWNARRLANAGQPMVENPVGVRHSAGITDAADWVNALHGYHYDTVCPDALVHSLSAKQGALVTAGGINYRVLVIPGKRKMNPSDVKSSPEVEKAIETAEQAGVKVIRNPYLSADLSPLGIERDADLPEGIGFAHRACDSLDIYFLTNQDSLERHFTASFRISGRYPELYDAVADRYFQPDSWIQRGGRTEVEVSLPCYGSLFILFRQSSSQAQKASPSTAEMAINGPWNLRFETTGKELKNQQLFDWSTSTLDSVRYYSGAVSYTTTFKYKGKRGGRVLLSLEGLHDLARVSLNGHDCGVVWTAPYQLDVTPYIQKGRNQLTLRVANTWANALRGADEGRPPFSGIWTNAKYRLPGNGLLKAGLLGPVKILFDK
jgi:hypothetical protein